MKLYFMIGLPSETDEDVIGIIETAARVQDVITMINGSPAPAVWRAHADSLPRPRAILMMSAHYLALQPLLGSSPRCGSGNFGSGPWAWVGSPSPPHALSNTATLNRLNACKGFMPHLPNAGC